jgi:undecaprenyl pyrophosphate synthase
LLVQVALAELKMLLLELQYRVQILHSTQLLARAVVAAVPTAQEQQAQVVQVVEIVAMLLDNHPDLVQAVKDLAAEIAATA